MDEVCGGKIRCVDDQNRGTSRRRLTEQGRFRSLVEVIYYIYPGTTSTRQQKVLNQSTPKFKCFKSSNCLRALPRNLFTSPAPPSLPPSQLIFSAREACKHRTLKWKFPQFSQSPISFVDLYYGSHFNSSITSCAVLHFYRPPLYRCLEVSMS